MEEYCLARVSFEKDVEARKVPLYKKGTTFECCVFAVSRLRPLGTVVPIYWDGQSLSADPAHGQQVARGYVPAPPSTAEITGE
jgi:hypothetical protein